MLDLRIAKPCGESWAVMAGDERVRHCAHCDHAVYDVSRMTEAEIEELVRRTEGRFCARVYRRPDGRIMTADCPRPEPRVRRRRTLAVAAAFGLATMVSSGCMGSTGGTPTFDASRSATNAEKPLIGRTGKPPEAFSP